ncbi:MAG: hypothetical protein WCI01_03705 [Chlorobiaceae bacterium]
MKFASSVLNASMASRSPLPSCSTKAGACQSLRISFNSDAGLAAALPMEFQKRKPLARPKEIS